MSRNAFNLIKKGYDTYFEIKKQLDDIAMFLKMYYQKHPRKLTNEVLHDNLLTLRLQCFDSKPISRAVQEILCKDVVRKAKQELPFSKVKELNKSRCMPTYKRANDGFYTNFSNVNNCVFVFSLVISKRKYLDSTADFQMHEVDPKQQFVVTDKAICVVDYNKTIPDQLAERLAKDVIQKLEQIPAINRKLTKVVELQKKLIRYLLWYERLIVFGLKQYGRAKFHATKTKYLAHLYYIVHNDTIQFTCVKDPEDSFSSSTTIALFKISKQATLKQFLQHIKKRKTNDI
jgi:hypothetical protein|nr:MAG TPA: hypothetical protein [Caudoviricetes sp.]